MKTSLFRVICPCGRGITIEWWRGMPDCVGEGDQAIARYTALTQEMELECRNCERTILLSLKGVNPIVTMVLRPADARADRLITSNGTHILGGKG